MAGRVSVRLEIENSSVRQTLAQFVGSLDDFFLQDDEDGTPPHLLILELVPQEAETAFSRIRGLQQTAPSTDIFLTSAVVDPQLLLDVLRAGVKEFLTQPLRPEEVQQAFQRFRDRNAEASAGEVRRTGRIISIIGGKTGVGTTTLVASLAAALRTGDGRAVAVVDLNLHGGDVPAFFDVNPLRSIRDIDLDLSRLDPTFLAGMMSKHSSGVDVLPLGDTELAGGHVSSECVDRTLRVMRTMYDFIVVDCGHAIDMASYSAMSLSGSIILVTSLVVPVVRRSKRLLDQLRSEEGALPDPSVVQVAVNWFVDRDQVILSEARDVLQVKPQWLLARDSDAATDALNNGQPVVLHAPRSNLAKSIAKMAADLGGSEASAPKGGFLSGMFRSVSSRGGR